MLRTKSLYIGLCLAKDNEFALRFAKIFLLPIIQVAKVFLAKTSKSLIYPSFSPLEF